MRLNYANAEHALKQSLEIQESLNVVNQMKIADLLHSLGSVKDNQGQYKSALYYYIKALLIKRNKVYGEDHPSVADTFILAKLRENN